MSLSQLEVVDEGTYDEMLGVMPPEAWGNGGFLVGEPFDHADGLPRFAAYFEVDGTYYYAGLMTNRQFDEFDLETELELLNESR